MVRVFMYLQFSKVCEFRVWVQLKGLFIVVRILMYLQFSKVCEFRVTLRATEWVFHYGANFYVSSIQQGLRISSHIESNWIVFSLWCGFFMYLHLSKVCKFRVWVQLGFSLWCGFLCIFSSARVVNFELHWEQLNGFFIMVQIFMYLQFSKVCKFRVTSVAAEWPFMLWLIFMYLQISKIYKFWVTLRAAEWLCKIFIHLQFSRIHEFWVTLRAAKWLLILVMIFMYLQFSRSPIFGVNWRAATKWLLILMMWLIVSS